MPALAIASARNGPPSGAWKTSTVRRLADSIGAGRRLSRTGSSLYSRAVTIQVSMPAARMMPGRRTSSRSCSQSLRTAASRRRSATYVSETMVGTGLRLIRLLGGYENPHVLRKNEILLCIVIFAFSMANTVPGGIPEVGGFAQDVAPVVSRGVPGAGSDVRLPQPRGTERV